MRYLFLILVFIANLSTVSRGQGLFLNNGAKSCSSNSNSLHFKQNSPYSNPFFVSYENYIIDENDNEDDVDESDNFYLHHSYDINLRCACPVSESFHSVPECKIRAKKVSLVPLFLRDNRFLI
jgi:hypothetical protein